MVKVLCYYSYEPTIVRLDPICYGAKMIHVEHSDEIPGRFEAAMLEEVDSWSYLWSLGGKPRTWRLLRYQPENGLESF